MCIRWVHEQLTVLVDDKVGLLANILSPGPLAHKHRIHIGGGCGGKAVINLMVKDTKRAQEILGANGYKCLEADSLVSSWPIGWEMPR